MEEPYKSRYETARVVSVILFLAGILLFFLELTTLDPTIFILIFVDAIAFVFSFVTMLNIREDWLFRDSDQ